jgi:hypothetical protein
MGRCKLTTIQGVVPRLMRFRVDASQLADGGVGAGEVVFRWAKVAGGLGPVATHAWR